MTGLQPEQATADDRGVTDVVFLDVATERECVGRFAQHEDAAEVSARNGRHRAPTARGEYQPVPGEYLTGRQLERSFAAIDLASLGVDPARDSLLVVPRIRFHMETVHRGAVVHHPRIAMRL